MSPPRCNHANLFTAAYIDRPVRWEVCLSCSASRFIDETAAAAGWLGGDGRMSDGCMDDVQVEPYCSKLAGPSVAQPDAGNSNRMVGLLRAPPKGVM